VIVAGAHSTLMMLGGEHLGDRYIWWNFVSSRKERIEQAKEDWKQGRILLPPTDNAEFIPLPTSPAKLPEGHRRMPCPESTELPSVWAFGLKRHPIRQVI
jgi:hypothetical protein